MKVFLSWSGLKSKAVADALKEWLVYVLPDVEAWMSDKDISAGSRWSEELFTELEQSSFGVICLTHDNPTAPWLLFEAGALFKAVQSSRVVPYCFELDPLEVQQPLAQFQSVRADKEGTLRLVRSVNELLKVKLPEERLVRSFDRWWPDLEKLFAQIPKGSAVKGVDVVKLERVYCAYTKEYENLGAEEDVAILESKFPGRVSKRPLIRRIQFEEDLSTGKYEILHLIGRTDPEKGDFFFEETGSEKVKCEGLIHLVKQCGARLVFLATCDSTVLGSRLERIATVITAYGSVHYTLMIEWERTFYNLLANGRPLAEAFDIAQASSDVPMTLHLKNDAVFIVSP